MPGEVTLRIFVGVGANGHRLKNAIKRESIKRYGGENMSRLLLEIFCEKFGVDLRSGKGKCHTGATKTDDNLDGRYRIRRYLKK